MSPQFANPYARGRISGLHQDGLNQVLRLVCDVDMELRRLAKLPEINREAGAELSCEIDESRQ